MTSPSRRQRAYFRLHGTLAGMKMASNGGRIPFYGQGSENLFFISFVTAARLESTIGTPFPLFLLFELSLLRE